MTWSEKWHEQKIILVFQKRSINFPSIDKLILVQKRLYKSFCHKLRLFQLDFPVFWLLCRLFLVNTRELCLHKRVQVYKNRVTSWLYQNWYKNRKRVILTQDKRLRPSFKPVSTSFWWQAYYMCSNYTIEWFICCFTRFLYLWIGCRLRVIKWN